MEKRCASVGTDKSLPLTLLDLTVIGAYLVPSHSVSGTAIANALLFDVRNGYPYATVSATASQRSFVPEVGSREQSQDLQVDAQVDAVANLAGELDKTLTTLRAELQQRELTSLRTQTTNRATRPAALNGHLDTP